VADLLESAPPGVDGAPPAAPPTRSRSSSLGWIAVVVVALALIAGIALVAANSGGPGTVDIVVPAGTADQLDTGEVVEVVPPVVHLEPGEALELDNRDSRLHVVGALRAEPGETTRQEFPSEGRYVVRTSLRSDGILTVLVVDPDVD
jgi:hypothetical protein